MGWLAGVVVLALAASIALFPTKVQHASENPAGAQEEPPAAPSELLAYDDAVASATFLSWRDNASNETTYIVERSVVGLDGPWDALATVPTAEVCRVPPTTCWYFDYDIEQEGDYWYRVAAVNESGQSPYSNFAQAGPQPRPGQVRGVVFHDRNEDGVLDPEELGATLCVLDVPDRETLRSRALSAAHVHRRLDEEQLARLLQLQDDLVGRARVLNLPVVVNDRLPDALDEIIALATERERLAS